MLRVVETRTPPGEGRQSELSVSEARDHLAELVNQAAYAGCVTYLTRRGRRLAVIAPVDALAGEGDDDGDDDGEDRS